MLKQKKLAVLASFSRFYEYICTQIKLFMRTNITIRTLFVVLSLLLCLTVNALTFDANKQYYITCQYQSGFVGIGADHESPYSLLYVTGETGITEDGLWKVNGDNTQGYTLTNCKTGQLLTWCDVYSNETKYLRLENSNGERSQRWTFDNEVGGFHNITSLYNPSYHWNLRLNTWLVGGYSGAGYTERDLYQLVEYKSGGGEDPTPLPDDQAGTALTHTADYLYVLQQDSTLTAIPTDFIINESTEGGKLYLTLNTGKALVYDRLLRVTNQLPVEMPKFLSYKFNNKYNDQLFDDAVATEAELLLDTIHIPVAQIGKWLTASFIMNHEQAIAYVEGKLQKSKSTRQRMGNPITYTLTRKGWNLLQIRELEDKNHTYRYIPFGKEQTVKVDFLTDHATGTYNVPRIDITTATGTVPMSKVDYVNATITIDGGGVYPNMETTDMLIRCRGNISYSPSTRSKNSYRIKFETKQKPLGMTKGKSWVLLANKQTGSMTSNAMEQKMAALMNCAAPCHIVPVELYINGIYRGSYNLTEKVGINNNSVALTDERSAAMLELDTYDDEPIDYYNAYNIATKIHDPDFEEENAELLINKYDVLNDWYEVTNTLQYGDKEAYTGRFDMNYLTSFLMTCDLAYHCELMHPKSVFLYSENVLDKGFQINGKDETPWILGPVWDCDWSFGYEQGQNYYIQESSSDFFRYLSPRSAGKFWNDLRYKSQELDKKYFYEWHKFMNDGRLQELTDYAVDYYNYAKKSFIHNHASACDERDGSNYFTITNNSVNWLTKRANYIYNNLTKYELTEEVETFLRPEVINATDIALTGDINNDQTVSTADAVCLLNHFRQQPNETFLTSRADLNNNGTIDTQDMELLCTRVMEQPTNLQRQLHLPASTAGMTLRRIVAPTYSEIDIPMALTIDEGAYAGLQMDVTVPEGIELEGLIAPEGISDIKTQTTLLENRKYRVLYYTDGGHAMQEGEHVLRLRMLTTGNVDGNVMMVAPTLSTHLGEEERLPSSQFSLHIVSIIEDGISPVDQQENRQDIYDLAGRKVSRATVLRHRGIYIKGNKKVVY